MKKFLTLLILCFTMVFTYGENMYFDLNDYKTETGINFPIIQHNNHYNISLINIEISTTKDPENITIEMQVTSVDPMEEYIVYRCDINHIPTWLLPQTVNYWNWMTVNDGVLTFRDTYPTELVKGNGYSVIVYKVNDLYVFIQNVWSNENIITTLTEIVSDTWTNPIYINPQGMISDKPWPGLNIVREGNYVYKVNMKE